MGKRVALVLAGCGVFDGSEIHEASAALVHLSRGGAEVAGGGGVCVSVSVSLCVSVCVRETQQPRVPPSVGRSPSRFSALPAPPLHPTKPI